MKWFWMTLLALLGVSAFCLQEAFAHGGNFKGPPGGVPPGVRPPGDPEPPPPPPSEGDPPDGPITPNDPDVPTEVPVTPDGTNGGDQPPPDGGPNTGNGRRPRPRSGSTVTFNSWRYWWAYNNDDILNLKDNVYWKRRSSGSALPYAGREDSTNNANPDRPTRQKVLRDVIPVLRERLQDPHENEDVHGGCLVALGKLGDAELVRVFRDAVHNKLRNDRGQKVDLGLLATESAAIALGLLPDLDAAGKKAVRDVCLEIVRNGKLRTRERTWCAVALGLQRDTEAVPALMELLKKKYADDNVPAGMLAGIGLAGDPSVLFEGRPVGEILSEALRRGRLFNRVLPDRLRAFCAYSLAKMRHVEALPSVLHALKSRRSGVFTLRSNAIAAGVLASAHTDDKLRRQAVSRLISLTRGASDRLAVNFALISLSQIGTPKAIDALVDRLHKGSHSERPYAALGLGTLVHYRDREGTLDPKIRTRILKVLRDASERIADVDNRSALYLARGLVKDTEAVETLVDVVGSRSKSPVLRTYAALALGLIGNGDGDVKEVLTIALKDRRSEHLRRNAAIAFGLIRDANAVNLLLDELKKAKSMTVQGQIMAALGQIGDHRAVQPLIEILKDKGMPVVTRAMASVGLGLIGDLKKLPRLARVSKNYNWRATVPDLDFLIDVL